MKKANFDVGNFLKQNNALFAYLRDPDGLVVGAIMGVKNKAGDDIEISWLRFVDEEYCATKDFEDACGEFKIGSNIKKYDKVGDWPTFYKKLSELVPESKLDELKCVKLPQFFCNFENFDKEFTPLSIVAIVDTNFYKSYRKEIVTYLRKRVNSDRAAYYESNHKYVPPYLRQQIRAFEYRCWKYFKVI
jgi:hypothetical protein